MKEGRTVLVLDEALLFRGGAEVEARCKLCGHRWQVPWDGRSRIAPAAVRCPRSEEIGHG